MNGLPSEWIKEAKILVQRASEIYKEIFPLFQRFTRDLSFRVILEGRVKWLSSVIEKMQRKRRRAKTFSDLVGIRITVKPNDFRFLTSKLSQWLKKEGFEVRKIEIKLPNDFMDYSAVHWDLCFRGFPIELQLMTPSQRKWAVIAHDTVYKGNNHNQIIYKKLNDIHRQREQELRHLFY